MKSPAEPIEAELDLNSIVLPHVSLDHFFGHYQLKTATTQSELEAAFKLRYDVFFREFAGIADDTAEGFDVEDYDALCDHLLVIDRRNSEVVACYRLLSSAKKPVEQNFYSESEFIIDDFLLLPERKLELGRACVHKNYRRGTVLLLLWKGIVEYAKRCGTRYMFGCSSLSQDQFRFLPELLAEISQQDRFITDWRIGVREKYQFDSLPEAVTTPAATKAHTSLMQIYLNAGARVGALTAYDRAFNCVDFFTVLDLHQLPQAFNRGLGD